MDDRIYSMRLRKNYYGLPVEEKTKEDSDKGTGMDTGLRS